MTSLKVICGGLGISGCIQREVNERVQCSNGCLALGQVGVLEAVGLGFLNRAGSTPSGFCEGKSLCGGPIGAAP